MFNQIDISSFKNIFYNPHALYSANHSFIIIQIFFSNCLGVSNQISIKKLFQRIFFSEQYLMVKLLKMKYRLSEQLYKYISTQTSQNESTYKTVCHICICIHIQIYMYMLTYKRHIEISHIRITLSMSTSQMCTIMENKNVWGRIQLIHRNKERILSGG